MHTRMQAKGGFGPFRLSACFGGGPEVRDTGVKGIRLRQSTLEVSERLPGAPGFI